MIKNIGKNRETRDIKVVNDLEYQNKVRSWLKEINLINPFSITLTTFSSNKMSINQNFKHFINRLNQSFLKNSNRRYKQKLTVIPIVEESKHIKTHIHCVIDNPYPERNEEFVDLIRESWGNTLLGMSKSKYSIDIQPMYSDGWIEYITKCSSKSDIKDSVDWDNLHLPPGGEVILTDS